MQVVILNAFFLLSSSLLFSTVCCLPNHHHNQHNDFPWLNLLFSLGIVIENQTTSTSVQGDGVVIDKGYYTSESTVESLISGTTDEIEHEIVVQNGTYGITSSGWSSEGLSIGYKVGIPIVSIIIFIGYWYCICRCCCACCKDDAPNVVVMQQQPAMQPSQPAPQIILQQPIIHQQAPPVYDSSQRWAQPPPQGPPQWGQPPQAPQWAPHPMGQQQHYSPNSGYDNSGYDNAGFNPATAPPPYNTGQKY